MIADDCPRPPIFQRRRARRLAVWNGALWSIGNGLASTNLVIYLAGELHAERFGLTIGLVMAAPQAAGLLRLVAPALIDRTGGRKRFCIATFFLSAAALVVLPWAAAPGRLSPGSSVAALVALWCLFHVMQYLGTVALWPWLGDVAPSPIRGRFFGVRERWMVAGTAAATVDVGLFVWGFPALGLHLPSWMPYGIGAVLGAAFMIAALVPLGRMPALDRGGADFPVRHPVSHKKWERNGGLESDDGRGPRPRPVLQKERGALATLARSVLRPFADARFLALMLFGCWFSFFNGLTVSAQSYLPVHVLGISLLLSNSLLTGMRLGQFGLSPWLGRLADRHGNRPMMIVCQVLVAGGLLFFAAASLWQSPAWLVGAFALWIAYAGLNVGFPNLSLKLSPDGERVSYIAAFEAVRGVAFAASTVLGGALVDRFGAAALSAAGRPLGFLACFFLLGFAGRGLGAVLLARVPEPRK